MKRTLSLLVALVLLLGALPCVFAEDEVVTLENYTPKVDKLVIQTTNRILIEGNDTDKFLEDMLGVEIDWIITNDFATTLNTMAADGKLPDLITVTSGNRDLFFGFVEDGLIIPLEDLIPKYAPNIIETRGWDYLNAQRQADGHIYSLDNYDVTNANVTLYRKDWVEKLGLKEPTNLDEFRDMLYAFVYNDPDGNGIDDTVGLYPQNSTFEVIYPAFGANPSEWIWKDGTIVYGPTQPEMVAAVTYLQSLYADGLIMKDYPTATAEIRNNLLYSGKLGACTYAAFNYTDRTQPAARDWFVDETSVWDGLVRLAGPAGEGGILSPGTHPMGSFHYTGISVDCEDPELVMLYLNFLATREGFMYIVRGEEGKHYYLDENGKAITLPPYDGDSNLLLNEGHTYTYTMPFLWVTYPDCNVAAESLKILDAREEAAQGFYAAMPFSVPAIKDVEMDAGMGSYVKNVITELIVNGGDVEATLAEMVQTLKSDYNLDKQTELVNAYAQELGLNP